MSETKMRSCVYQGSACPKLSKMVVTFGTTRHHQEADQHRYR